MTFVKHADFAEEVTSIQISKHNLVTIVVFDEHRYRSFHQIIELVRMITSIDDYRLSWIGASMAVLQIPLDHAFPFQKSTRRTHEYLVSPL